MERKIGDMAPVSKVDCFANRTCSARISDVRPCERRDERATPGIRGGAEPVCDPLGVETCSSISVSVRGYGEKYLNDSPHHHKLNK